MAEDKTYIIIDDNEIDIYIAKKMIELSFPNANIITFNNGTDALEMVKITKFDVPAIMLVDINMPIMTGFQFMEQFEKLSSEIQKNFIPYFLTSSINESDMSIAKSFKSIKKYINKPLVSNYILEL
jgi:CheY-like chemotaxis protein